MFFKWSYISGAVNAVLSYPSFIIIHSFNNSLCVNEKFEP